MKYLNRNGADQDEHDPLTAKVIGLAIEIHKELGTGFMESIYHRALEIDLAEAGISFVSEAPLSVKYKNHILGTFAADLIIESKLLVELKALENLSFSSEVQVVNYLKASNIDVGLILNFGTAPLQIKRKYRNRPKIDTGLRLHEV
jgi:GxxExxY protein